MSDAAAEETWHFAGPFCRMMFSSRMQHQILPGAPQATGVGAGERLGAPVPELGTPDSGQPGFPTVGAAPAQVRRTGLRALLVSMRILATCLREPPEFAARRRRAGAPSAVTR